jgi:hypothetical protein
MAPAKLIAGKHANTYSPRHQKLIIFGCRASDLDSQIFCVVIVPFFMSS